MTENIGNDFTTTLAAAILTTGATAITVVSGTGAPAANFRILVESELMLVTSVGAGTNWTVQRGIEGTTPATHAISLTVAHVITKGGLEQHYVYEQGLSFSSVLSTESVLVPSGRQMLVYDSIRLDGDLRVDGTVVML